MAANKEWIINDPIHGAMTFSAGEKEVLRPIVDHPVFQRLRGIKQLGLADFVYPGAVHTRFNHSLGACFMAKTIANQVNYEGDYAPVLIAALLHDIGHGPFSHAFESLVKNTKGEPLVTHEDWTDLFIQQLVGDDKVKLSTSDVEFVIRLIKHNEKIRLLEADMVSSQLDADRLDYLLRDSHFCGVSYGTYDQKWLLTTLRRIEHTVNPPRLGISSKGQGAIENYLMARRLMHTSVYYHGKVKAAEFQLMEFIRVLQESLTQDPKKFVGLVSETLLNFLQTYVGEDRAKASAAAYPHYSKLCDYDVWFSARNLATKDYGDPSRLAERLLRRHVPEVHKVESAAAEGAKALVEKAAIKLGLAKWQLNFLEVSVKSYKADRDPILLKLPNDSSRDILGSSTFANLFADRNEKFYFLMIDREITKNDGIRSLVQELESNQYVILPASKEAA